MIKVGRLPGRMYSVEYTEGITVGQAIASAKAQAEEVGRSLETVNCQVRVAGSEVSESQVLTDNAVVTITQKIKGNSATEVYVDDEPFLISGNTIVRELLQLVEKDIYDYSLIPLGLVSNKPLTLSDTVLNYGTHFKTVEKEYSIEEESDYSAYACDDEDGEEEVEEEHSCNCGNNIAIETCRPMRPNANTNFNYSNNGIEVYMSVSNSNEDLDINKVIETSKVIYSYVKSVVDGL